MANPALKNGYLSIANELVEQFAKRNIPGNEMRVIWVVLRKTWGWKNKDRHKDWDIISISQFEDMAFMKHANVARSLKSLVAKRLLLKSEKGYKFNQNYDEWVVAKRLLPTGGVSNMTLGSSQKATKTSSQKATPPSSQSDTNKRNQLKKKEITKEREIPFEERQQIPITPAMIEKSNEITEILSKFRKPTYGKSTTTKQPQPSTALDNPTQEGK